MKTHPPLWGATKVYWPWAYWWEITEILLMSLACSRVVTPKAEEDVCWGCRAVGCSSCQDWGKGNSKTVLEICSLKEVSHLVTTVPQRSKSLGYNCPHFYAAFGMRPAIYDNRRTPSYLPYMVSWLCKRVFRFRATGRLIRWLLPHLPHCTTNTVYHTSSARRCNSYIFGCSF